MKDSSIEYSLIVLGGPLAKRAYSLAKGGILKIGSSSASEVQIPLPGVEPVHARITLQSDGAVVEDGPSRSGVYVNDDRVAQATLIRDTDILWLGAPGAPESIMLQFRLGRPTSSEQIGSVAASGATPAIEEFFVADDSEPPTVVDRPAAESSEEFIIDDIGASFESRPPIPKKTDTQPIPTPAPEEFFIAGAESAPSSADENMFIVDDSEGTVSLGEESTLVEATPAELPQPPAPEQPTIVEGGKSAAQTVGPPKASAPSAQVPPRVKSGAPAAPSARPADAPSRAAPPRAVPPRVVSASGRPRGLRAPRRPALTPRTAPRSMPARARTLPPRARRSSSAARLVVLLLAVVVIVAAGAYLALWHLQSPKIVSVTPSPARVGGDLTITGQNFSSDLEANVVLFGDQAVGVQEASSTRLVVKVPEVPLPPGHVSKLGIRVRTGSRESSALEAAIYLPPRIQGLSPDVGMPGEEVVIAGAGWTSTIGVFFGNTRAEVLSAAATYVRVRVPQIIVPQGTSIPVVITVGDERSNAAPFIMGQLPLVIGAEPTSTAAGDVVRLNGRGFRSSPEDNVVKVGGVRALILDSQEDVIEFVVPRLDLSGQVSLEVLVKGRRTTALGILGVKPAIDPVPFRFVPEPFIDEAGHVHAVLVSGVGPTFVLSASGGKTAAQRAVTAAQRLNAAADLFRTSRDADIEIVELESAPRLVLSGQSEPLLEITQEDVAAYTEDWTGQKGRGGLITAARLATWWRALARDLVLLLVRGESPRHAAALASEGRILEELHQATLGGGVTRSLLANLKPTQRDALRVLAYRVPSSVVVKGGDAVATAVTSTTTTAPASVALRLDRPWRGTEVAEGRVRMISIVFEGDAGTLTYEGGVALSVPVLDVEQPRPDAVTFMAEVGGGVRYYAGQWDGQKVSGTISSQPSGTGDLGTFELRW